jgi:uncharacterized protein (TIGR02246 family)
MKVDIKTENGITAVLKKLADAYAERNLKNVMSCFAPDSDVVLYGTGADEKRIGLKQIQAQVERDWSQTETAAFSFDWISISGAETVAWAAADGEFRFRANGQDVSLPARMTFVLEKGDGEWRIVQSHFSTPTPGQEEGQSF